MIHTLSFNFMTYTQVKKFHTSSALQNGLRKRTRTFNNRETKYDLTPPTRVKLVTTKWARCRVLSNDMISSTERMFMLMLWLQP